MFSTDQSHLRKYLATLGVAIAAGTLSLAGLFMQLQQDLVVTTSTLTKLTPTARSAIMERQHYLAIGTSILPYFVVAGFVGGLSLSAYGLVGWGRRQKVTDALEDLQLERGQVEFRQMTAQEQAEKLKREAEKAADSVRASSPKDDQQAKEDRRRLVSEYGSLSRKAESSLQAKLISVFGPDNVQADLIAQTPSGRSYVDAIVRRGEQDLVFEIKYTANVDPLARAGDVLDQLGRAARVAQATGRNNVSGVGIIVLPDTVSDADLKRHAARANEYAESRDQNEFRILMFRYSDFLSLPPDDLVSLLPGESSGDGDRGAHLRRAQRLTQRLRRLWR